MLRRLAPAYFTLEACVRSEGSSCGVYGAQSGAGTGLFMVRRVMLGQVCRRPVPFPSASIIQCVLSIHLLP